MKSNLFKQAASLKAQAADHFLTAATLRASAKRTKPTLNNVGARNACLQSATQHEAKGLALVREGNAIFTKATK